MPRCSARNLDQGLRRPRTILALLALIVVPAALVPPFSTLARQYEWLQAAQYAALGIVAPVFVTLGLIRRKPGGRGQKLWVSLGLIGLDLVLLVVWRLPPAVDALGRDGWLLPVEALTLLGAGAGLWYALVWAVPASPGNTHPTRIALAAVTMWSVWVMAYLVGLSHARWYRAIAHHGGLSFAADQQLTSVVLWVVAGSAFIPVIFWSLFRWLATEDDADEELARLLHSDRRHRHLLH
jgi:hypothetical protein